MLLHDDPNYSEHAARLAALQSAHPCKVRRATAKFGGRGSDQILAVIPQDVTASLTSDQLARLMAGINTHYHLGNQRGQQGSR